MKVVFPEKLAIAPAAEHQIRIKLAPELGPGLGENTGQIGYFPEGLCKGGNILARDFQRTVFPGLDHQQVVAPDGSNEEGAGGAGVLLVDVVLNEVKELPGLAADSMQETQVLLAVILDEV